MERLIIGTLGAKWKDKGNIPEGSHWTTQHCHSVKACFGKHDDTWSCVTWEKNVTNLQNFINMGDCHVYSAPVFNRGKLYVSDIYVS